MKAHHSVALTRCIDDEKWVEQLIQHMFNKTPEEVTFADMKGMGKQLQAMEVDVTHWTIGS